MWYILVIIIFIVIALKLKSSKKKTLTVKRAVSSEDTISAGESNSFFRRKELNEKVSQENFSSFVELFEANQSAVEKHYISQKIIVYLSSEYGRNPSVKNQLLEWCLKNVSLYKDFLVESHFHLFHLDSKGNFILDEEKRKEREKSLTFDKVKNHPDYFVPSIESYFVLCSLYKEDGNLNKLEWIRAVGQEIGIRDEWNEVGATNDLDSITETISVKKSGEKGKLAFLDSQGTPCSTEDAFKDYMVLRQWKVMRAEVAFWQAMFCLVFWEEIFEEISPRKGQDIPPDLFKGDEFYKKRSEIIEEKYRKLTKMESVHSFINEQINRNRDAWTRLLYNGDLNLVQYIETDIVQEFLKNADPKVIARITHRIALNPSANRSGISDFIVWKQFGYKFVEVKKIREKVRDEQRDWITWLIEQKIPVEIIRVRGT